MRRREGSPVWIDDAQPSGEVLKRIDLSGRSEAGRHDECWLQNLLHDYPEIFPIGQIETGFSKLVPLCTELPLLAGGDKSRSLDNLFATPDGQLVLIEVKLWRNHEARRAVVAQALEYAAAIFRMSYSELEAAVLKRRAAVGESLGSLFEIISGETNDVAAKDFSDKVADNLRRGRAVVAVAGDGIHEELMAIADLLQSHAGHRFTFALVELAVYETPSAGVRVVVPSVLAKTQLIERGVVRIEDGRVVVELSPTKPETKPARSITISEDEFFEALGQNNPAWPDLLRSFLSKAEALGVYSDVQARLSLKFALPSGRTVNSGVVDRNGTVDFGFAGDPKSQRAYIERMAALIGSQVSEYKNGVSYVKTAANKFALLSDLLPQHEQAWLDAMEQYIKDCLAASPDEG